MLRRLLPVVAVTLLSTALALPAGAQAARCNGVPNRACVFPFPNDYAQTKRDARTPTGRRVAFARSAMPANASGSKVNPREWNRNDGFSPGQPIMVHLSFLTTQAQFRRSGIVPVNDLARYRKRRQPLLLLDERTGRRQIVWGELDAADVPASSDTS